MKRPLIFAALLSFLPVATFAADFIQAPDRDNMDGTVSRALVQQSDNVINLKFPYEGDTHLNLVVLQTAWPSSIDYVSPSMIKFMAERGQVYCGDVAGCKLNYRVDNGPVSSTSFTTNAEDGSSNSVFITYPNTLAAKLKGKKKLTLEIPFFQEGKRQFTFDLDGIQPALKSYK